MFRSAHKTGFANKHSLVSLWTDASLLRDLNGAVRARQHVGDIESLVAGIDETIVDIVTANRLQRIRVLRRLLRNKLALAAAVAGCQSDACTSWQRRRLDTLTRTRTACSSHMDRCHRPLSARRSEPGKAGCCCSKCTDVFVSLSLSVEWGQTELTSPGQYLVDPQVLSLFSGQVASTGLSSTRPRVMKSMRAIFDSTVCEM